jgi:hypothetical protein
MRVKTKEIEKTPEEELDVQIDELLAAIDASRKAAALALQRLRPWRRAGLHQGGEAREEDLR